MGISGLLGFITKLLSDSIGKLLAVWGFFPFILFIISAANSGMKIDNVAELNPWITTFVTNVIPIILAYAAEGSGITIGAKLKNYISNS